MLNRVEHERSFITSGPGHAQHDFFKPAVIDLAGCFGFNGPLRIFQSDRLTKSGRSGGSIVDNTLDH